LLDFIQLPLSHTGKALFEALIGACKRFSIEDHILSITTDNHTVNDGMVDQFKKHAIKSAEKGYQHKAPPTIFKVVNSHIRCIAHLINLSAQAVLASLKSTAKKHTSVLHDNTRFTSRASYASAMGKTRRIIVRYRRSNLMRAAFACQCAAFRLKAKRLSLDMEVRWNSTYIMLQRFIEMESPIRSLLAAKDAGDYDISHLLISADEWIYLKRLCEVFSYYYSITLKMSAQSYPTMYNVLPLYIILRSQLVHAVEQNEGVGTHSLLATAIQAGVDKLDEYLDKAQLQSTAAIAMILNPRMKLQKLWEYGWTAEELLRDQQAFFDTFDAYVTRFGSTQDNIETEDEDSDDELALYGVIQTVPHSLSGTEAQRYLNEPLLKKGDKMTYIQYWKGASTFYPILARIARDYGTILSTSVPSESVFSIAGLQITKRRNRLAPKTMGVIMCLRS